MQFQSLLIIDLVGPRADFSNGIFQELQVIFAIGVHTKRHLGPIGLLPFREGLQWVKHAGSVVFLRASEEMAPEA